MASKWVDIRYNGWLIYNVNKCDYNEKKQWKNVSYPCIIHLSLMCLFDWGHGVGYVDHIEGVQKLHIKRGLHLHQCCSFKKLKICIF